MSRRWRPSLGLVLGGALAGTLTLSFAGLVAVRYIGPEIGFRNAAMALGVLIALATGMLGWLLVRLLLRPIRALERFAAEVRRGRDAPTPPPGHFGTRELHKTALSVIDMAETLRDREATIRSFTDHVTHEIKSPVAAIRAAVELLEDGGTLGPADLRLLAVIDGARTQIEGQLAALRSAARARQTRYVGTASLRDLLPGLRAEFPGTGFEVSGDRVPVPLSAEGLRIVLTQMLRNSVEHGANRLILAAEATDLGVSLTLSDDGSGISPGNAARVFEPFFTTRRDSGGTGMGLAIARNIVTAHRGQIALLPGRAGTTFRLTFAGRR